MSECIGMAHLALWKCLGAGIGRGDRRAGGRVRQESIASSLGPVLDLSPTGARILASRRLSGTVKLVLRDDDERHRFAAQVCWAKRRGMFKHEVGLAFLDLSAEDRETIRRLTMKNRVHRTYYETAGERQVDAA